MLNPIRNIVVPTDFSECAEAALAQAVSLAKLDGAAIHLVHALAVPIVPAPYEVTVPAAAWDGMRDGARERIEQVRAAIEAEGVAQVTASVSDGAEAAAATRDAVESCDADLVVMGTHGYGGVKHAVLGSVAERALRTLHCPVLAVKGPGAVAADWKRILLAVDFSEHSDRAVEAAATLAERLGAALDVVHAVELPQAYVPYAWSAAFGVELETRIRENVAAELERLERKLADRGLTVAVHARNGKPSHVVAEVAEELGCDAVVMGTRGNTGLSHLLLGSVAERTLRTAPCSVLAVTAPE